MANQNPNFVQMSSDKLYHLGLDSGSQDFQDMFGDVKVSPVIKDFRLVNC